MKIILSVDYSPQPAMVGKAFVFEVADRGYTIGRAYEVDFQLDPHGDLTVSRRRFLLEVRRQNCFLADLQSTNRTKLNGVEVQRTQLKDGDLITIANTRLRVRVAEEPEADAPIHCVRCENEIPEAELGAAGGAWAFECQSCRAQQVAPPSPSVTGPLTRCHHCGTPVRAAAEALAAAEEMPETVRYFCPRCVEDEPEDVQPRTVNDYRLLKVLGQGKGGEGVVYKSWHEPTGQVLALKKILPKAVMDKKANVLFQRGMAIQRSLVHSNIVRLLDQGMAGREHYLASEYLADGDVGHLMTQVRKSALPVREACDIVRQILDRLEYAHHKGFVHRDIKPQNVLLCRAGNPAVTGGTRLVAKLSDFGLARSHVEAGLSGITRRGETAGTLLFMAPQQIVNSRHVYPPADVRSMGVSLYYMLTGVFPFRASRGQCKTRYLKQGEDPSDGTHAAAFSIRTLTVASRHMRALRGNAAMRAAPISVLRWGAT